MVVTVVDHSHGGLSQKSTLLDEIGRAKMDAHKDEKLKDSRCRFFLCLVL